MTSLSFGINYNFFFFYHDSTDLHGTFSYLHLQSSQALSLTASVLATLRSFQALDLKQDICGEWWVVLQGWSLGCSEGPKQFKLDLVQRTPLDSGTPLKHLKPKTKCREAIELRIGIEYPTILLAFQNCLSLIDSGHCLLCLEITCSNDDSLNNCTGRISIRRLCTLKHGDAISLPERGAVSHV